METIDDNPIPLFSRICMNCVHFRWSGRECDAFPARDSIPEVIWRGKNDHTQPYNGDNGIRFERIAGTQPDRRQGE